MVTWFTCLIVLFVLWFVLVFILVVYFLDFAWFDWCGFGLPVWCLFAGINYYLDVCYLVLLYTWLSFDLLVVYYCLSLFLFGCFLIFGVEYLFCFSCLLWFGLGVDCVVRLDWFVCCLVFGWLNVGIVNWMVVRLL